LKLPNAEDVIIDAEKIQQYILSSSHPVGRFKAAFFSGKGYSAEKWQILEKDLRGIIIREDVIKIENTAHGDKYTVKGLLDCPNGEKVKVITAWIILNGEEIPRFITVYPGG